MNNLLCEHDEEWMGQPAGYVPTSWRCVKCGLTISAGEMLIRNDIAELRHEIKKLAEKVPA